MERDRDFAEMNIDEIYKFSYELSSLSSSHDESTP
jgi:hypothetical protein